MKRSIRNKISHTQARRKHVKARARLRYDLELNREDLREMVAKIAKGEGKFVAFSKGTRCGEWLIHYKDEYIRAIFDRRKKELVTLLPFLHEDFEIEEETQALC